MSDIHSGSEERPIRDAFSCPRCGRFLGKEPHGVGYCEPESSAALTEREKLVVLYNRWITLAHEAQSPMERVVLQGCARELREALYGR